MSLTDHYERIGALTAQVVEDFARQPVIIECTDDEFADLISMAWVFPKTHAEHVLVPDLEDILGSIKAVGPLVRCRADGAICVLRRKGWERPEGLRVAVDGVTPPVRRLRKAHYEAYGYQPKGGSRPVRSTEEYHRRAREYRQRGKGPSSPAKAGPEG